MESYIFIVGKPDPQRESAQAIRRLGYKVGLLHDIAAPLKSTSEFDMVIPVDFANLNEYTHVLPDDITVVGLQSTYENYIVAKAHLGVALNLPTLSVEAATAATDKLQMRRAFSKKATQFTPKFANVSTLQEAKDFAATTTFPLIIKPANLVKSLLVMRCNNENDLEKNFRYAQANIDRLYKKYGVTNRTPRLIIEEFIAGKSCSIAAFVDHEGTPHLCEGVVSLTTATEHGIADNYLYERTLPLQVGTSTAAMLFTAAEAGIRALDMRSSPAHVELIYTESSVKIVEIGARIGGYRPRMYQYSYGLDLITQEIQLSLGNTPLVKGSFQEYCSVFELFPEKEGKFQEIYGDFTPDDAHYFSVKPQQGAVVGPAKYGYKAAAVVIIRGTDQQGFDRLCRKVDSLQVRVT